MFKNEDGFFLSTDNDSHWYVIPVEKETEWAEFLELDPDDEASWDIPEWAEAVGGAPSLIVFNNYRFN